MKIIKTIQAEPKPKNVVTDWAFSSS